MKRKLLSMILAISIVAGTVGTGYVCAEETDDTITIEDYGFVEGFESTEETSEESTEVTTEEEHSEETYSEETTSSEEDVITNEGYFEGYESAEDAQKPLVTTSVDEVSGALSYSQEFSDVIVNVDAPAGVFPEGTRISVAKRYVSQKVYEEYKSENAEIKATYSFDIKAYDPEGNEVQPDTEYGTVSVTFSGVNIDENTEVSVYHISDDLKKVDEVISDDQINANSEGNEVVVECEHFSVYMVVIQDGTPKSVYNVTAQYNKKIYIQNIFNELGIDTSAITYVSPYEYSNTAPYNEENEVYNDNTDYSLNHGLLNKSYIVFKNQCLKTFTFHFFNEEKEQVSFVMIDFLIQETAHDYQIGPSLFADYNNSTRTLTITGTGASYSGNQRAEFQTYSKPYVFYLFPEEIRSNTERVVVESGATALYGTFYDFVNLREVELPSTLKTLSYASVSSVGTFENCSSLETLVLPNSLTSIGDACFRNSGIKTLAIPEGIVSLGRIFGKCDHLEYIEIPSTVTIISSFDNLFGNGKKPVIKFNNITLSQSFFTRPVVYYDQLIPIESIAHYPEHYLPYSVSAGTTLNGTYYPADNTYLANSDNAVAALFSETLFLQNGSFYGTTYGAVDNDKITAIYVGEGVRSLPTTFKTTYPNLKYIIFGQDTTLTSGLNTVFPGVVLKSPEGSYITKWESGVTYNGVYEVVTGAYQLGNYVYANYNTTTKTLNVFGSGTMYTASSTNYQSKLADIRDQIEHIVIGEGVTTTGGASSSASTTYCARSVFANIPNLVDVTYPSTITEIKQGSFYGCSKYVISAVPTGITSIGRYAVRVPYTVVYKDTSNNVLKTDTKSTYYNSTTTSADNRYNLDFFDLGLRTVISKPAGGDEGVITSSSTYLYVDGSLPAKTYTYVLSDVIRAIPDGYHLVNKYNVGFESSWADESWSYGNGTDSIVAYLLSNESGTDYKLWFIGSGNMCCLTPFGDWYSDIPWFCDITGYDDMSGENWHNYESGLRKITEIFYSDGITSVSGGYYTGVTSVDLPDSVKYIGKKAFQYSLLEQDSVTLNDGLLDIYVDAFANTSVLITSFPSSLTSAAQRYGNIPYVVEARDLDGNVLVSKMYYRNATNATQRITLSGYYTYGAEVTNPSLAPTDRPEGYTFIKQVTGSQTAYVTKTGELVKFVLLYADNNELNHTLTFNQYDGMKICDYNYTIGEEFDTPVAGLVAPTETGKTFVFAGWRDENKRLYGDEELKHTLFRSDKVFTAYYTSEDATATYTVTFRDDDNTVITTTEYAYGATVVQPPVAPRKIKNASLMKVFTGWDKPVETTCTKDAEYKATYREEDRTYTVKFVSTDGGTQIYSFDGFKYGDLITSRNAYLLDNIFDDVMVQKSTLEAQGVTQDISTKGYYNKYYYEDFKYASRWGYIENYAPTKLYELTGFKDINDGNKFYSFADLETATVKSHMYLKPVYEERDTSTGDYTVKIYNQYNLSDPSKALNYGNTTVGIDTLLDDANLMAEWHIATDDYWYMPDEYFLYSGDMNGLTIYDSVYDSTNTNMYHQNGMQIYLSPYKYGQSMMDGYIFMNADHIVLPKYTSEEVTPQTRDVYIFSKQPNTSGGYSDKCVASLNVNVSDTINICDYIADDNANVSVYYSGNNKYVYQNMYYYQDINGKHMINPNGTFTVPKGTSDYYEPLRLYPDYGSSPEYYRVEWLDWDGSIYHTEAVLRNTNLPTVAPPTREDDYYNSYLFDGWANVAGGTVPTVVTGTLKLQATYTADYIASSFKVTIPASIALDYNNSNDKFEGNLPVGVTINKNTKDSHPTEYYVAVSPESAITLTDSDTSDTLNVDVAMDKKKFYMSDLTQNGSTYTGSEDVNLTADSKVGSFSGNLTIGFRSGYDGE